MIKQATPLGGILGILKPSGITSAHVVRLVKETLENSWGGGGSDPSNLEDTIGSDDRTKRRRRTNGGGPAFMVGHGGTLDPMVSGVLGSTGSFPLMNPPVPDPLRDPFSPPSLFFASIVLLWLALPNG